MEKKEYDFLSGIVLIVIGLAVIWESIRIWQDVGDDFTQSPGLMPAVLGFGLIVAAGVLVIQSYAAEGNAIFGKIKTGFAGLFQGNKGRTMRFARIVLAVAFFTFVLMPNLPFWISAFIFMVYTMVLAGARKPLTIFLMSCGIVLMIVLIFDVLFRVPLPTNPIVDDWLRGLFASLHGVS